LKIFDTGHELSDLFRTVWALISRESAEHQQNNGTLLLHCSEFDLLAGRSSQFEVWRLSADRNIAAVCLGPVYAYDVTAMRNSAQKTLRIDNDELPPDLL